MIKFVKPIARITSLPNLLILLFLAITQLACSPGESRVERGNREGILHMENATEPQTLDPHVSTGVPETRIIQALFEGLVAKNPKDLSPIPGVAERWEISDDKLTYRFYLRENARWSNGDPITAEDFRWSWERALTPALANKYAYMMYVIKNAQAFAEGELEDFSQVGVRVIDRLTLEVELKQVTPYFLQLLDHHSYFPVHKNTLLAHGKKTDQYSQWTRPDNIVSNGPFTLEQWKIFRIVTVVKNPLYWDQQRVQLNGIHYYPIENYSTAERMFKVGQVHKTNDIPLDKIPVYRKKNPEKLRNQKWFGTYYYSINTTIEPLNDVRVRRALALAIDRQTLTDQVMFNSVTPAYAITPPGANGYNPPKLIEYNPEKAQQLLAEAGFPNGEGWPKMEILYNTSESHRKIAVTIQQMWKKVLNIDVGLVNQEWKVYLDTRTQMDYQIARAAWIGDVVDPISFLDLATSTNGNNHTGYSNPEYDKLALEEIPAAANLTQRNQKYYEAETMLMRDLPFIPIYVYNTKYLLDPSVKGIYPNFMNYYNYKFISVGN